MQDGLHNFILRNLQRTHTSIPHVGTNDFKATVFTLTSQFSVVCVNVKMQNVKICNSFTFYDSDFT